MPGLNWVFSNVFDVLVRVDKTGTKLDRALPKLDRLRRRADLYVQASRREIFRWFADHDGRRSLQLLRIRDNQGLLWSDSYKIVETADATDPRTLTVKLKTPSAPFLSTLALPNVSVLSKKAVEAGEDAFAELPTASSDAFTVKEWRRGDRVILERTLNFRQADRVKLDGVEWISVPGDNTRMLNVQAGQLDTAIFVPFSRVTEQKNDPNLSVSNSTRRSARPCMSISRSLPRTTFTGSTSITAPISMSPARTSRISTRTLSAASYSKTP